MRRFLFGNFVKPPSEMVVSQDVGETVAALVHVGRTETLELQNASSACPQDSSDGSRPRAVHQVRRVSGFCD
jgi:hypothetical protein